MKCYAMAKEGSMYCRDDIDMSWPSGGIREVIELNLDAQTNAFKQRVLYGVIVEVDLPANKPQIAESPYRIYEGDEAREVQAQPAAPVVVQRHGRSSKTVESVTLLDPEVIESEKPVIKPTGPRRAAGFGNQPAIGTAIGKVTARRAANQGAVK